MSKISISISHSQNILDPIACKDTIHFILVLPVLLCMLIMTYIYTHTYIHTYKRCSLRALINEYAKSLSHQRQEEAKTYYLVIINSNNIYHLL
jgi:hypothetical protein